MEQYLIFLPGFIYVILGIAHYMNYRKRRFFVNKWIQDERIHKVYFYYLYKENEENHETNHNEHEINMLLNRIAGHNWLSYWAAFVITFVMVTIFSYMTLTGFVSLEFDIFWGILDINYPFFEFISGMKQPIYFAALGALVWGFYEFLQRYRNQNWSAVAQHMIWFKIPISMIICYFIFNENDSEVASIVAFGIGAFPIEFLRKFVMNATSTKLGGQNKNMLSSPRWESIRGITDQVIEKIEEYGVENVHQLASADPFRLHFNTNIEFVTILDFIDQALLISFINSDRTKILQQNGITGAIDIAFIHDRKKHLIIDSLAILLGFNKKNGTDQTLMDFNIFESIISNIADDPRVKLILGLWDLNELTKKEEHSGVQS